MMSIVAIAAVSLFTLLFTAMAVAPLFLEKGPGGKPTPHLVLVHTSGEIVGTEGQSRAA
jgi:hypothetical protein